MISCDAITAIQRGLHPGDLHPEGLHLGEGICSQWVGHTPQNWKSGWYTYYWNAFLLLLYRVIDTAASQLTKTAITVTAIFVIALGYELWCYLLAHLGVTEYIFFSIEQKFGKFFYTCGNSPHCIISCNRNKSPNQNKHKLILKYSILQEK